MACHSKKISLFLLATFLLFLANCGHPNKLVPEPIPSEPPAFYLPEKIRVALVLGSGGVRGMAHLGVLEELETAGIPIDLIVGCSAGSIVGALYADNPHVSDLKKPVGRLKAHSVFDFELTNCRYGLFQLHNMRKILKKNLKARFFSDLKIPLVVVASDLHSGELFPMGAGELIPAIEASCSIPFFFVPSSHMGRILVDGGVVNPVPVQVAKELGAEIIIAVDLCELLPKTFPTNLFQVVERSFEIIFMWQNDVCTNLADIVIRPRTMGVGAFDDSMQQKVYLAGKYATRKKIAQIVELIEKKQIEQPGPKGYRLVKPKCHCPQICSET